MLMKKAMIAAAVVAAVVMGMIAFLGQANEMVYSIGILLMTASLTVALIGIVHRAYWGKKEANVESFRPLETMTTRDFLKDAA